MTDRELLEMAAKAAGFAVRKHVVDMSGKKWCVLDDEKQSFWNPLTDDGDALRLAVKLDMVVHGGNWLARAPGTLDWVDGGRDDPYAATRRAIVRAAAKIGEQGKNG